ncbi:MAG: GtrA family protein [Thermocrispum sp.]
MGPTSQHTPVVPAAGSGRRAPEQFAFYVAAGAVATGLHAVLFLLLRDALGAYPANLVAIVLSATANVEFHRYVTFRGKDSSPFRRVLAIAMTVLYDATYSTAGLLLLQVFIPDPTATQQTATIVAAAAIGGLVRFMLLRSWVFTAPPATDQTTSKQEASTDDRAHPGRGRAHRRRTGGVDPGRAA